MKRLAIAFLSGSLLVAMCLLGAPETAGAQPMGFATTTDTPTVTGEVLNPAYFAHAAYVMQGVSDRDKVFALPLRGIPELAFLPTATGIDPESATWSLQISHPQGIGAEITDHTLFIWSNNAAWSGYGVVTLTATASGTTGSVTIPVTVFRTDSTLTNSEGKKDYFVPWSPQLDINRVKSVEQFLDEYACDEESLDREINWSAYEMLGFMHSVTFTGEWIGEGTFDPRWTWEATRMRIDYMLDELAHDGVDWILWRSIYFMPSVSSSEIVQLFSVGDLNRGTAWMSTPVEGLRYVVDQAHNKGMRVAMGPFIADVSFSRGGICPLWSTWFANYGKIVRDNARLAEELGVDLLVVGESLINISGTISSDVWGSHFSDIIRATRVNYSGPLTYLDCLLARSPGRYFASDWLTQYPFAPELDVISSGAYFAGCVVSQHPTASEIAQRYPAIIESIVEPYAEALNKPLVFFENGVPSMEGVLYNFMAFAAGSYSSTKVDLAEQANWYTALLQVMPQYEWFRGFGWFGCSIVSLDGAASTRNAFRGKPAEAILRQAYGGDPVPPPATWVDGKLTEWADKDILFSSVDGIEVSVRQAGNSLFLMLRFQKPWPETHQVHVAFYGVAGGVVEERLILNYDLGAFWAYLCGESSCSTHSGQLDIMGDAARTCLELYVPLRLLDTQSPTRLSISLLDASFHTYLATPILQAPAG